MKSTKTRPKWLNENGGPKAVSQLGMAFGAAGSGVGDYLPKWDEIPEEFKRGHTYWNELTSQWFFKGVSPDLFVPREGIDKTAALRQIQTCLGSFEPKHEHKEAGVAYLMSLFFEAPSVQGGNEKV